MQITDSALQARQASLLLWLGILAILVGTMAIWGLAFLAFFAIGWTVYGAIRLGMARPALGVAMLVIGCAATWIFGHQFFADGWHETQHVFALHHNNYGPLVTAFGGLILSLVFWIIGIKTGRFWLVLRAFVGVVLLVASLAITYNAAEHGKTQWTPAPLHSSWPGHRD